MKTLLNKDICTGVMRKKPPMLNSLAIMRELMLDRTNKVFTDGVLRVDGESYYVHQLILKISSPYFVKLFDSPLTDGHNIELKGVSKDTFEVMLDFLYGKEIDLTIGNVKDLIMASDMFCVDLLFQRCKIFFEGHWREMEDISAVYQLADHLKLENIVHQVLMKFTIEYLSTFPLGKDISEVIYDVLRTTLENDEFRSQIREEHHLMEIIWEWLLHNPQDRLQYAEYLISRVNPENIPPSALENRILLIRDLFKDAEDGESTQERVVDILRKKINMKKARMTQLRIAFRVVDFGENDVQIIDSLNWKIDRFLINFRIQEIVLVNDIVYLFGNKKVSTYDFRSQIVTPVLELKNNKFRFGVTISLGSLYLIGGIEQLKPNQVTSFIYQYDRKFRQWLPRVGHEAGTFSLCSPSILENDGTIYIAGGECKDGTPMNKCYRYSCTSQTFATYDTTLYVKNPKLAVKDNTLYMFSTEKGASPGLQRIHLHTQSKNPLPLSKVSFRQTCTVLDALTIPEGIVLAFRDDTEPQDVYLCLYHPEEDYMETLGYSRGPDPLIKDDLFGNNYKVFLRQF